MGLNAQSRLSVGGLLLFGTTTSLLAKIGWDIDSWALSAERAPKAKAALLLQPMSWKEWGGTAT